MTSVAERTVTESYSGTKSGLEDALKLDMDKILDCMKELGLPYFIGGHLLESETNAVAIILNYHEGDNPSLNYTIKLFKDASPAERLMARGLNETLKTELHFKSTRTQSPSLQEHPYQNNVLLS